RALTPTQQVAAVSNHESRIAELTQRLRADTQRMQERMGGQNQPAPAPAVPAPLPSVAETAATAAVAAALEDVTIRPIPPKLTLFEPQPLKPAALEPAMPKA